MYKHVPVCTQGFMTMLLVIVKTWKQPSRLNRCMDKPQFMHTMEYYSSPKIQNANAWKDTGEYWVCIKKGKTPLQVLHTVRSWRWTSWKRSNYGTQGNFRLKLFCFVLRHWGKHGTVLIDTEMADTCHYIFDEWQGICKQLHGNSPYEYRPHFFSASIF